MPAHASSAATSTKPDTDTASVEFFGAFLLQVARHEQDGLSRACAVLAAASAMGVDPAAVLRAGAEV